VDARRGTCPAPVADRRIQPSRGKVDSKVAIRGEHFIVSTDVSFNGVPASFQVLNTQFIRAIVPQGATTGPILVRNPGGTAKSKKPFTVQ